MKVLQLIFYFIVLNTSLQLLHHDLDKLCQLFAYYLFILTFSKSRTTCRKAENECSHVRVLLKLDQILERRTENPTFLAHLMQLPFEIKLQLTHERERMEQKLLLTIYM